eukprot:gene4059-18290_t
MMLTTAPPHQLRRRPWWELRHHCGDVSGGSGGGGRGVTSGSEPGGTACARLAVSPTRMSWGGSALPDDAARPPEGLIHTARSPEGRIHTAWSPEELIHGWGESGRAAAARGAGAQQEE